MIDQIHKTKGKISAYDVLAAGIEAVGGQNEVDSDRNATIVADFKVNDTTYLYKEWSQKPSKSKIEMWYQDRNNLEDDTLIYANGDDGENLWEYSDEEVTAYKDGDSTSRKIREGLANMDYADPDNRMFTATLDSVTYIDGVKNYRVKITNRQTDEEVYRDYNAKTFLLTRETKVGDTTTTTDYDDWRDVGGLMVPFKRTMSKSSSNIVQEMTVTSYKRNTVMPAKEFNIPTNQTYASATDASKEYVDE
jgi:hypothetical protein